MTILSEDQVKNEYFNNIAGFSADIVIRELSEYQGEECAYIGCTQLYGKEIDFVFPGMKSYSERDKKRILKEWIVFLSTQKQSFKVLHFTSYVPQKLFNAACCQENLEELRVKWGRYPNLSELKNLHKLRYLYLGPCVGIRNIDCLEGLKSLSVLHIEGFKNIEDYSSLAALDKLEQLVISGQPLQRTPVKDLEFLREMPNLRSIWIPNVRLLKKYTAEELADLKAAVPNLHDINGCIFGKNHLQQKI